MLDQKEYAIFATRYTALAIDPESGDVRFEFPFGKRGPTVNAATPLIFDNQLFLTSNYGVGCTLKQIDRQTPRELWSSDHVLSCHYDTPIYYKNHLYGVHGREDTGIPELRCIEATSGKISWRIPDFGAAHLILADDKLLALRVNGTLTLIEPNEQRYVLLSETEVSDSTTRALPALAAGRLYLRDNVRNSGTLQCLLVGR